MEILKAICRASLVSFAMISSALWAATPCLNSDESPSVVMAQGFKCEIIYDKADPDDPLGIGIPRAMAIDPTTGDLYITQSTKGDITDIHHGGYTLIVSQDGSNPHSIPFNGQGIGFASDGTMYFGVSNLLLGVWQRPPTDVFRRFATIPSIRGVQVGSDQKLWVAESHYGPTGLYDQTVLTVDRGDGYFQPVFKASEASDALGIALTVISSMAVDNSNRIYVGIHNGQLVRYTPPDATHPTGQYIKSHFLNTLLAGLNEATLATSISRTAGTAPDNIVYQYDAVGGQLFAILEGDTDIRLVSYGKGIKSTDMYSGVASDGKSVFLTNRQHQIIKISPANNSDIRPTLTASLGSGVISGTLTDEKTGSPISGVTVSLQNFATVTTDAQGKFSFDVAAGLYEINFVKKGYFSKLANVTVADNGVMDMDVTLNTGLPKFVAAGLKAEIVANKSDDTIDGAADVNFDKEGNIYTPSWNTVNPVNGAAGNIVKVLLDPVTREKTGSYVFAEGGVLSDNYFNTADQDLNIWASSTNTGVMKLPQRANNETITLKEGTDIHGAPIVEDQDHINRLVSVVKDVDGANFRSNGFIYLSSGKGGEPGDTGTFNTLVEHQPSSGAESIFSHGYLTDTTNALFSNNDMVKVDAQDRLLVTNGNGNVVRVKTDGFAELLWPGDGTGKPNNEALGTYTSVVDDGLGHVFIRGDKIVAGNAVDVPLRMMSEDGNSLLTVAGGLNQDYGGMEFDPSQGGKSIILSEDKVLTRITSLDGRTIADNILSPPPNTAPTVLKSGIRIVSSYANPQLRNVDLTAHHKLPPIALVGDGGASLLASADSSSGNGSSSSSGSSGGGAIAFAGLLLMVGAMGYRRRKSATKHQ